MLDLIICEFQKLKRRRLFQVAFLTTFIVPVLYSLILSSPDLDNMMSVIREDNGFLILIPLLVVLAANLFFEEHDYDTLKNLMCVPVKKSRLVIAKLLTLLLFACFYQLAGGGIAVILALISGAALKGWGMQILLTAATGFLLWCATMPCVVLVVWCNKSYIVSVIIAFAYMCLGYLSHISETFVMVPLGLNAATFLPVPIIFRWLYQFHSMEGIGGETLAFYNRFSPYFVPTPVVFAVLSAEAAVCIVLMVKIYRKQKV